jgi:phosphoglycolate phosphatase-like HAD superfamily hydrolase
MHVVMFDIDGTLVDCDADDARLYAEAVRSVLGVQVDETYLSYHNVTDSGILEEILAHHEFRAPLCALRRAVKQRFVELVEQLMARRPGAFREVRGARALVERVAATPGLKLAFATGGWAETARLKLAAIGIDATSLPFASASDAPQRTAIMRIAERRATAGATPACKTYFGDGDWDKRASAALGYRFVAVGRRVEHDPRFRDLADTETILDLLCEELAGVS